MSLREFFEDFLSRTTEVSGLRENLFLQRENQSSKLKKIGFFDNLSLKSHRALSRGSPRFE